MICIKRVNREAELEGILDLQAANLRKNLAEDEAAREGFLTAEYDLDFLRRMNQVEPSVVAVVGDRIVGYALVATQEIREGNPLLADLFHQIDQLEFRRESLRRIPYVVVGQLCIAKGYRGLGLVGRLYRHFRESLEGRYACAITDVARSNVRSLKAHWNTGFRTIHTISFDGLEWEVILWDWNDSELPSSVGS